jgi:hypothetical protein
METKLEESPNTIQDLLDGAEERGYLTLDEILEAFPRAEDRLARLDEVLTYLQDQGVEIYDDIGEVEGQAEGKEEDQDEVAMEDIAMTNIAELDMVPIEDAVGLYMAELNYYRLKAGRLEFRLPLRSSRLKDYAPKGGGFQPPPAFGGLKRFTDNEGCAAADG